MAKNYRAQLMAHPKIPISLFDFLTEELQISRRYLALCIGADALQLIKHWKKRLHLLCLLLPDEAAISLAEELDPSQEIWMQKGNLAQLPLDDDSIDMVCILDPLPSSPAAWKKELQRLLRLNSYVFVLRHELEDQNERSFSWAFSQFFKQLHGPNSYPHLPQTENFDQLYPSNYKAQSFANQLRLDWPLLEAHYQACPQAFGLEQEEYERARKGLRILFEQYQQDGKVVLNYQTKLYYGLFNLYTPAISLRKNIFFQLLRPFAFLFYLLIKLNLYFWRAIYKLQKKQADD